MKFLKYITLASIVMGFYACDPYEELVTQIEEDRQGAPQDAAGAMGQRDKSGTRQTTGEGTDLAKSENKKQKGTGTGDKGPSGGDEDRRFQDDDIVARQLREAAENESDPELKAKLWKEYRDYKRSL